MIGNRVSPSRWRACALLLMAGLTWSGLAIAAKPAEPRFSVELLQQDFDALYRTLQAAHFDLFARRPKAEYDALHATMRAGITRPMTAFETEVLFQRFVAFGDVAHAHIAFPAAAWEAYRQGGGRALPLYPRFDGARFVVSDDLAEGVPVGAEVLAMDGEPIGNWYRRLRAHLSADSDYMARALMAFRWPALLWLEVGEREAFEIAWRGSDGVEHTTRVDALTQGELRARMARHSSPTREERAWTLREDGVAYLRPGPFYNIDPDATDLWDPRSFIAFIDAAFEQIISAKPRALLIDLRDNPGGDASFSDPMVAWFAHRPFRFASRFMVKSSGAARASNQARIKQAGERVSPVSERYEALYAKHPPGEVFELDFPEVPPRAGQRFAAPVYLLVNRHSFSNTVTTAALAQDFGFAKVLGEETSDLATTYGAMEHFALPGTGIQVGFPKALIVRPNGDRAARGVVPDVSIPTPVGDDAWQAVLDAAIRIIDAAHPRVANAEH